jgi:biotin-dependent carboxylase-like uncharacterized protein
VTQIRVVKPGFFTTVQDLGRRGYAHLGLSAAGAADALSLRVANLLVGNDETAAALEMTLLGGTFEFEADAVVAVTGAQAECVVSNPESGRRRAPLWEAFEIARGERLAIGATTSGARVYLAVAGGLAVQQVLGSASTLLAARMGGVDGRALREGDVLCMGERLGSPGRLRESALDGIYGDEIRVTRGPQFDWFRADDVARFLNGAYEVTEYANRNGLRLSGEAIAPVKSQQLLTEGVSLGAVQVPADGQPIILFVDQQTTGGYPKIANVIAADMHRVGQLKPHDIVRFREVTIAEAVDALRELERWIMEALVS